jgi:hypothetical protein
MTKKETIAKHWQELVGKTPAGVCHEKGWVHSYFPNGILDITDDYGEEIIEKIDYQYDPSGVGRFRPKSLRGIEDNNGWIKIETVEDLPKDGVCLVIERASGATVTCGFGFVKSLDYKNYIVEQCSHYKPIPEQLKPLY